jgi:S-adenosylmethionine hydrolase
MGSRRDTVSFLSDYGRVDEFVGVVHSVIRTLAPHATVIDITHEVPPHEIRAGSLALARASQYLAAGVVLAVVDPGVGTDRRAVAVEAGPFVFVGPDNGLLAGAVAMVGGATWAVELTSREHRLDAPAPTFAGRDIFAPAAAHLCNGGDLSDLGPPVDPITMIPGLMPVPRDEDGTLVAEVLWVDHFGNLQLNATPEDVAAYGEHVSLRWTDQVRTAHRVKTYGDLRPGQLGLVVDSYGLVSVALDRASAASQLRLRAGDAVTLSEPN